MPIYQINIRTGEIDEILGKTPNSLIRWGVSVIFMVIVVLLVGSWFFKYPDKITSQIEITTLSPPAVVVAKTSGKIDSLFVQNNQKVNKGSLLAVIDNPANFKDVFTMYSIADSLERLTAKSDSLENIAPYRTNIELNLGELQYYYSGFIADYNHLAHFIQLGYYQKKIVALDKQVSDYNIYYNYSYDQKRTMMADFQLAEKDYNRYKKLFKNNAIAESELDQARSRYLNKKYSFQSIRTRLANIKIQISQLENSRVDLQLQQKKDSVKLLLEKNSAYKNLMAQLSIWKNRYLLQAPVTGRCVFTQFRTQNQNITLGESVMTVILENASNIIGRLLLPVRGSGKVEAGQKVNVRLENFPYMEYGQLEGIISKISSIPDKKGFYYVEVNFPKGMITSYGKTIPFSQNMQGMAEVITKNIRLLYRIIQPIRSLFTENI